MIAGPRAANTCSTLTSSKRERINVSFILKSKDLHVDIIYTVKQVFPTLDVIGWYSVGKEPSSDDISLHAQFASSVETPIFLLFDPDPASGTQALPLKIYESATVTDTTGEISGEGKFVELEYGIETGEAERIAVDGVAKGGAGEEDTGTSCC